MAKDNMKKVVLGLITFIQLIQSFMIPLPQSPIKNCLRITIADQYHTIFVDDSNETDHTVLKECIIKNIHLNQSILLLKGFNINPQKGKITNNYSNVIIMTKLLNHELFDKFIWYLANTIKYQWNTLYIVVTANDGLYNCIDGNFNEIIINEIHNFLNDLWHKFQLMRVILVFPYSCPQTFVVYGGKIHTNMSLFNRTIKFIRPKTFTELSSAILKSSADLTEGYPIKVVIFPRFPTSIKKCNQIKNFVNFNGNLTKGLCGVDGLIMRDAMQYFKFNVLFSKEKHCNQYGYVNFTKQVAFGSLGCVLNGTVDISFNSRFMVMYPNNSFHYLHYVMHDSLCALLPVPGTYPLWHYPYMAFDSPFWVYIILLILILSLVAWISGIIINNITGEKPVKLQTCIVDVTTCILCGISPKKYSRFYILRGLSLFFSVTLLSYYQGFINYSFTTFKHYERIKTLQELYDSKYVLYTSPPVRDLLKPLKHPNNTQEANFLERAKLQPRTDIGIVLDWPKSVSLGRFSDVRSEILLRFRERHGKPMIYVVEECFRHYYLSYISRIGFPFSNKFKIFMERLLEAGIPDKYYTWTRRTLQLPDTLPKEGREPRPIARIKFNDQIIPFGILLSGYLISTAVFIVENYINRKTPIVKPTLLSILRFFNTYARK